jgi:pyridine nucleotide-disulfide oxidoreductase family protein
MARQPFPGVQAVLVSPFPRQVYSGMVPGLVAGHYQVDDCTIALEPLARAAGVELVLEQAARIDAASRTVTLGDGRSAHFDVLSLDTGATIDRDAIPGARKHAMFLRPMEHFVRMLDGLDEFAARRVLDVVVVGGGAAGFEIALALAQRFSVQAGEERARVCLVAGTEGLLANYPQAVRERALARARRLRVTVFNDRCAEITPSHVVLAGGPRLACDAPVMALPASASPWLAGSGLALDEGGFVLTGPTLQSVSHPDVFAAGDVSTRQDAPHPRSGVYAVRAGPPLAFNLRRQLAGGALKTWQPQSRSLNLLSCGSRHAIASWGSASIEGHLMWRLKDRIDRRFIGRYAELAQQAGNAPPPKRPHYDMQTTMPLTPSVLDQLNAPREP